MNRLLSVKASAGTGKTYRLANRYISLLNIDNPANIVAITFTKKAANEMKERIINFLEDLGSDTNALEMISKESGLSCEEILKRKDLLLNKFLISRVNIQTIDSFLNTILRKFSFYVGIRNDFQIGSEDRDLVFKEFLSQVERDKELDRLIRVAKLDERLNDILSFFETLYKKDKELDNIKLANVDKPDDKNARSAFDRFRDYILNSTESSNRAKDAVNIDFYEIPSKTWFYKNALNEYSYFKKKSLYESWFEDVLIELKNYFKEYYRFKEYSFLKELLYFYTKYKSIKLRYKKRNNLLDFLDIEHLVFTLLKEGIEKDFLYFRLDGKIDHILIDEFQDTSITQWEIFDPLVKEIASGYGAKGSSSFFYVGDVKQAIYRYRGGQKELFDKVIKDYSNFGLKVESLDVNFRSDKNIVEFVNSKFNLNEKPNSKDEGFVEVLQYTDDIYETIYEKIIFLNQNGVADRDIAVLVYQNKDILELADFLESRGKKVVTAKNEAVANRPFAKAIISLMKYLNDKEQKIEKLNFLSLIGKKWGDYEIDIEIKRPFLMVKEIMTNYELIDDSTLKLLEFSRDFDTLVDFVEEIDDFQDELPLKEFNGISIMTIHKSKGLAFDHTIVVDRIGGENHIKDKIIFDYENARLKDLKIRFKDRESIDEYYKNILQKEKKLEIEDKRNVEYVAFTRAKHSLIIIKKEKSSFITPLEEFKKGEIKPSKKEELPSIKKIDVELKNYGTQNVEIAENEYKPNDFRAIYLGDALHYYFECEDLDAVRNLYGDYVDFREFKEINFSKVKEKLKNIIEFNKAEFFKEVPFILDKKIGRVDLLLKIDESFIVIDYKSKKPNDESNYERQVRGYINAIKKLKNSNVRGFLYYVDIDELKEVNN
jgi:exodeoxyribonuclease V beta subunit